MNIKEAKKHVLSVLKSAELIQRKDVIDVSVEYWAGGTYIRIRVAEISYAYDRGSGSYLQSYKEGLLVCAALERYILDLISFPDDINNSLYILIEAVYGDDKFAQDFSNKLHPLKTT